MSNKKPFGDDFLKALENVTEKRRERALNLDLDRVRVESLPGSFLYGDVIQDLHDRSVVQKNQIRENQGVTYNYKNNPWKLTSNKDDE